MFLPSKKPILPCHKNGYLQSASDARKYRDRFKRNPLAKVADMFIPRPLRAWRWWPCCCGTSCSACGTTITSDGIVSWFEHTVDEETGEITRVDLSGDCVTFYVDSVSGGGAESGTGTEEDPWTNLNTVFSDSCIYAICTTAGCPKVKVLVTGTIDYAVAGIGGRNYGRKLVIEPWGEGRITVEVSSETNHAIAISTCIGVIWKNTDVSGTGSDVEIVNYDGYGFYSCSGSTFDNCTGTGTGYGNYGGYGFYSCSGSTFDNCTGTGTGYGSSSYGSGSGFTGCSGSTFNDCVSNGYQIAPDRFYNGDGYGFNNCDSSTFDSCTGTGTTNNSGSGHGFYSCSSSTFNACDGIGYSTYNGCCGFYDNASSSFLDCTDINDCASPTCDSIS